MKLIVVAAAVVAVAARIFATILVTDGSHAATIAQPSFVFLCLFVLMVLADAANGHAVLPAFILGLVMSRHYQQHREEQKRTRVVAFALPDPFFFIKGGMNVPLGAVVTNLGLLAALLAAKMIPEAAFVYPLAHRAEPRHGAFTTLLMSTGLTFGTISSLYRLNAGIIDKTQFSLLVTVVVRPTYHAIQRRPEADGDNRFTLDQACWGLGEPNVCQRLRPLCSMRATKSPTRPAADCAPSPALSQRTPKRPTPGSPPQV